MSLMGTLAKVAIGIAVAKGVGSVMQKKSGTGSAGSGGTFGGTHSPGGGGGLGDIMGDILGGGTSTSRDTGQGSRQAGGSAGGLGGLLEELGQYAPDSGTGGRAPTGQSRGGLDDLIGGLGQSRSGTGGGGGLGDLLGGAGSSGGLGDLLGGLLGGLAGAGAGGQAGKGGSFSDILNQSLGNRGEPDLPPSPQQDAVAALMLRAMIQAAKSDGKIDANEQKKLLGNLGDVSAAERRFVEQEMAAPIDIRGLAGQVPRGLEAQIYTMSVTAIDLDNQAEAQYLHQLASAMGLEKGQVNHIHAKLRIPALYA
ncbi:MAG: DUF533 domain-containing protein [Albidovulum sp.]